MYGGRMEVYGERMEVCGRGGGVSEWWRCVGGWRCVVGVEVRGRGGVWEGWRCVGWVEECGRGGGV